MKKAADRFVEAVTKYKSIAIYIPGSPDPDAIASAYAIKEILAHLSVEADIFAEHRLSLPQNQKFIDRLEIPVYFGREVSPRKYDAYIVPDYQNNRVASIGDRLPCAAHIDHHPKLKDRVESDFTLIRTDSGSTSTLVALLIKNLEIDFPEKEMVSIVTALTFGIQTDTDNFSHTNSLDTEALNYLSEFVDRNIIQDINDIPPSPDMLLYYKKAKENEKIYKNWGFYGIGFIDAKNRDYIAIAADTILKNSDHETVVVFAVIENQKKEEMFLDVSLRSGSSSVDLNRLVKQITPNGGGRQFKGAYQVNLDYFRKTPERDMLWKVVEATTVDTLRRSRDALYSGGFEGFYRSLRDKISSILKK